MSKPDDGIPFYLMPIAAVFGIYSAIGGLRVLYLIYANLTHNKEALNKLPPSTRLYSRSMLVLVITVVASLFAYASTVAQVERAMAENEYALFDPFDILGVSEGADAAEIKQAYRSLSRKHHPDKGGDQRKFMQISTAYRALTDSRDNYEKYGHPDGPLTAQTLTLALPEWILNPQGTVAVVMVLSYLGMFAGIIYFVIIWVGGERKKAEARTMSNSVSMEDLKYLVSKLRPDSTHMDILVTLATTPEIIQFSTQQIERVEMIRTEKIRRRNRELSGATKSSPFDLAGAGWAEDEEDEAVKKAKAEEAARAKTKQELNKATGKADILLEGLDEGVLGQRWVESVLEQTGSWPLGDLGAVKGTKFHYKGKKVTALEHPAIRRNLCMMTGRLNSFVLNTHSDLLEAVGKNKIDQTYFKSNMEYRQRTGILLEACLRLATTLQSYRLAKTVIETVAMFKIGVAAPLSKEKIEWFDGVMKKQYGEGGLPRLNATNPKLETPDEPEIATGDMLALTMDVVRPHAEAFTKTKVAQCEKRGIPPQIGLQSYREGWWVLVRTEKLHGGETPAATIAANPLIATMKTDDMEKFEAEVGTNRLVTVRPIVVANISESKGEFKLQWKAPSVPGNYRFLIAIKSQEFLGADTEFAIEKEVVCADSVGLTQEVEEGPNEETKKNN